MRLQLLILNICFSKSKDESVIDIKKETKKQFEGIYGSGWKFKWNINNFDKISVGVSWVSAPFFLLPLGDLRASNIYASFFI